MLNSTTPKKFPARLVLRAAVIVMIVIQVALTGIFLLAGEISQASGAFPLALWMALAYYFESRLFQLQQEKESLAKFLNTPPVESEGGEA